MCVCARAQESRRLYSNFTHSVARSVLPHNILLINETKTHSSSSVAIIRLHFRSCSHPSPPGLKKPLLCAKPDTCDIMLLRRKADTNKLFHPCVYSIVHIVAKCRVYEVMHQQCETVCDEATVLLPVRRFSHTAKT